MNENLSLAISVGVPAIISVVGFVVTIFTLKKNFQNELMKQKASVQLDKMAEMPYEVLDLMDKMINSGKTAMSEEAQKSLTQKMNQIFSSIYAYGSSKAIHILAAMQSENYKNAINSQTKNVYRVMAFYILLTAQIRFDITGEIVSPEEWFKIRMNDFDQNRGQIAIANNCLVGELGLSKEFKMQI